MVLADIPGLIEGAHEGAGLGDRFLGHVERCAAILHLVDGTGDDPIGAWRTVRAELEAYDEGFADKPEILAISKIDAMPEEDVAALTELLVEAKGLAPMALSSASCTGAPDVLRRVQCLVP